MELWRGGGVTTEIPSVVGVWIFSGNTHWKERVSGCIVFQSPIIIICYHPLGSDLSVNPPFLSFAAFKVRVPEDFCNYFFQYYCCPFCLICA